MLTARTIRRLPVGEQDNKEILGSVVGAPWDTKIRIGRPRGRADVVHPKAATRAVPLTPGLVADPSAPAVQAETGVPVVVQGPGAVQAAAQPAAGARDIQMAVDVAVPTSPVRAERPDAVMLPPAAPAEVRLGSPAGAAVKKPRQRLDDAFALWDSEVARGVGALEHVDEIPHPKDLGLRLRCQNSWTTWT